MGSFEGSQQGREGSVSEINRKRPNESVRERGECVEEVERKTQSWHKKERKAQNESTAALAEKFPSACMPCKLD